MPVHVDALKSKESQWPAPQLESLVHGVAQKGLPFVSVTQQYGAEHWKMLLQPA